MKSKESPPKKARAREAALKALFRVEQDRAYLNLVLPGQLQGLKGDERSLAARLAAGTLQRLNTIDWSLSLFLRRSLSELTPWIRNLLRLSAYQLLYLNRVPAYAAIDEAVYLARRFGHRGVAGLVNAVLRRLDTESGALPWPDPGANPVQYLSLRQSQPEWLVSRVIDRLGFEEAGQWCMAANERAPLTIRPNLLRTTPEDLTALLGTEGVEIGPSPLVPGIMRVRSGGSPAGTGAFKRGLLTVQGESSALVAPLLDPAPGDKIIDLCSAPGGKATHLAELIEDRGLVVAVDLHVNRLRMVEKAARRLGLTAIKTVHADGRKVSREDFSLPDSVLVDAPCSGLGVIRRLPEIKWRRKEKDLPALKNIQLELLNAAASLLPAGGKLLYSVCSNEPEETMQVVDTFSSSHKGFVQEDLLEKIPESLQERQEDLPSVSIWPHRHGMDGFFIACWYKKR